MVQKDELTPEELRQLLAQEGKVVSLQQAELILNFLLKMAHIVVASYLKRDFEDMD